MASCKLIAMKYEQGKCNEMLNDLFSRVKDVRFYFATDISPFVVVREIVVRALFIWIYQMKWQR